MRGNSIIMILLALVFGIAAVVLANVWLDSQRGVVASTDSEPVDTIVVAATALRFGDVLTPDNLREIAWPAGAMPEGVFKTKAEVLTEEGQRQALTVIGANEPVLSSKVTGAGQRATLSAVLADGMRAMSIRVNDVLGVAGFVRPGDRVDVLLTRNMRNTQGQDQAFVDVLLQSVKVVAVDQLADEDNNKGPTIAKAVTLEVSTKDAQKLTLAAGVGQLSLALRQVASSEGELTERVTLADLTGETPDDIAAKQAELARQAALEAAQRAAEEKFAGLRDAVERRLGSVEDELNRVKSAEDDEPEVREVVQYIEPPVPQRASIGVYRGMELQLYDVPRQN